MNNPTILLLGDSLIDFGNWSARLKEYQVISSGLPGECSWELLERVQYSSFPGTIDFISLMTGTNDLFSGFTNTPETIHRILTSLSRSFPTAPLILTSLLPYQVMGLDRVVKQINAELESFCNATEIIYFDLHSAFAGSQEQLFDFDGVHLSELGYQVWAANLKKIISEHLAKDRD